MDDPATDRAGEGAHQSSGEPWLNKRRIAAHFDCSVRWIELRMEEGLPHAHIAGRAKFRVSETEPWLAQRGHIERKGDQA